jgi:hypothetical protein
MTTLIKNVSVFQVEPNIVAIVYFGNNCNYCLFDTKYTQECDIIAAFLIKKSIVLNYDLKKHGITLVRISNDAMSKLIIAEMAGWEKIYTTVKNLPYHVGFSKKLITKSSVSFIVNIYHYKKSELVVKYETLRNLKTRYIKIIEKLEIDDPDIIEGEPLLNEKLMKLIRNPNLHRIFTLDRNSLT